MIQALIFDFDGLILDTEMPEFQSWQEIYAAYNHELLFEVWATGIGTVGGFDPYAHLESLVGKPIERRMIRQTREQRFEKLMQTQKTLDGVEDYLVEARRLDLKLGLASSSTHHWVEGFLKKLGLQDDFDCIKCSDDVKRVKPDPELYLAVLSVLNLQPQEAIAFEDSPNGAWAAKRAGLFCVAVPNPLTRQLPLDHADLRLNSLAELPLEKLLQKPL